MLKNTLPLDNQGVPDHKNQYLWALESINASAQTQLSLQEKIIKMYEIIQRKTMKNIEAKKNNQILKAQVDAYEAIINKILAANKLRLHQTEETSQTENKEYREINLTEESLERSNNETYYKNVEGNYNQQRSQQSRRNYEPNVKNEEKCYVNQYESQRNSAFFQPSQEIGINYRSSADQPQRWKNQDLEQYQHHSKNQPYKNDEKVQRISELQINFDQQKSNIKYIPQDNLKNRRRRSVQDICSPVCSPRASIDMVKKVTSPGKSFLKKGPQNMSSGNLESKYSSLDIQNLWNDTQASNTRKIQKAIGIPNGMGKQYIKLLKGGQLNSNMKVKNKQKKSNNK